MKQRKYWYVEELDCSYTDLESLFNEGEGTKNLKNGEEITIFRMRESAIPVMDGRDGAIFFESIADSLTHLHEDILGEELDYDDPKYKENIDKIGRLTAHWVNSIRNLLPSPYGEEIEKRIYKKGDDKWTLIAKTQ